MKSIIKNPGEDAQTVELKGDTLPALQASVGGYVETVYHEVLEDAGITAWANEEGLLVGLSPNLLVYGQPIVGPVVFTGHNDEGETIALTDEQAEIVGAFLEATTLNNAQRERIAARIAEVY